ncbi:MAG: hypothetical protein ACRCUY_07405 [Thermoguttaceae bacterium]
MDFWFRLPIRTRLGIIAAVLLVIASFAVIGMFHDPFHRFPTATPFVIRFAPILFLLWLCWTDLKNIPLWVFLTLVPIVILCAIKPALLFLVVPSLFVVLFIMPKKKK